MVVVLGALSAWVRLGPLPDHVLHPAASRAATFTDRNGIPLDAAAARALRVGSGASATTGPAARGPSLAKRADRLASATLAAEDERFRSHPGVDPVALGRAAIADVKARRIVQGGSTISQQLVKLRLGRRGDSLGGKVQESIYALRLEHRLSKDQILSAYLSEAPYGGRVIGADAAAQAYFAKPVSQLTWAEAAFLAAIPQRPTAFNPRGDATAAVDRQRWILGRLRRAGTITVAQERAARAEALRFAERVDHALAPHFTAMVAAGAASTVESAPTVSAAAGAVRTTLDAPLQKDVAGIARHHRALLRKSGAANVAVVVLDNRTGAVRAWEGSGNYFDWNHGGMINGPLQKRQTGSTIKPFVYGMAFEDGLAPGDVIDDAPFDRTYNGNGFHPQNYDKKYRGIISLRTALGSSVNVAAVKLLDDREPEDLVAMLERAGIELDFPASRYGLSLALGTAEIDLLDLTRAYAAFARGGRSLEATFTEPAAVQRSGARVVSAATAFLISDVLSDNEARASAFGRTSALRFPFPVAAKTGTSQDFHDNWVVGYTADFTVGVWVGNFDRLPLKGATGVTGAGPIFHAVMLAAHDRLTPGSGLQAGATLLRSVPDDLVAVDPCDGRRDCESGRTEYVWAGSAPAAGRPLAAGGSGADGAVTPTSTSAGSAGASLGLKLIEPVGKGRYLIDPGVPLDAQELPLQASGGSPPYAFTVDGQDVPSTLWSIRRGPHRACVRDATGHEVCNAFTVG